MPRGLDRGGVPGDGVGPVAVAPQEPGQACGQCDDPGVLAGPGGVGQAGEQAGALGSGPPQRLLTVGQVGNRGRYRAVRQAGVQAGLAGDEGVGAGRGVLVVIQQPGGGTVPVTVRVQPHGQSAGVLADQVVQPVPALGRLGEQVLVVQRLQAAAAARQAGAVQGGGGVGVDVRAGVRPEPPEQPLLPGREVGIGHVERRGFYRPDPSYLPALEQHIADLRADRETALAIGAADYVLANLTAEIDAFAAVADTMRHRLSGLDPAQRAEVEEASRILRRARAARTLPLTDITSRATETA